MGFLDGLFGPSKAEIWEQLAYQIGAQYTEGGFFGHDRVDAQVDNWIVTLDVEAVSSGRTEEFYTRLRAPFINPSGRRFAVHRRTLFTGLGEALGFRDIAIGDPFFDEQFVVSGNDEAFVVSVFTDSRVRALLEAQPDVSFEIADHDGWFDNFPDVADELRFRAFGIIKDIDQLQALFDLFAAVLHRLTEIGAADAGDPQVRL